MLRSLILVLVGTLVSLLRSSGAQESTPAVPFSHGVPELLVESLVRDRESEQALAAIVPEGRSALTDDEVLLVQQVLSAPSDSLLVDAETGIARSVRQLVLDRIARDEATHGSWMTAVGTSAQLRWKTAVESGNRAALALLAKELPLTRESVDAVLLLAGLEAMKTGVVDQSALRLLEQDCAGTVLAGQVASGIERLRTHFPEPPAPTAAALSLPTETPPGTLSAPWIQPAWTWRESSRDFPDSPQPDAGAVLDQFDFSVAGRVAAVAGWRPVLNGSTIVTRSPYRLVAFDLTTGREAWTIPTETFRPIHDETPTDQELRSILRRSTATSDRVALMSAFGLMSADADLMYFVDGFDLFESDEFAIGLGRGVFEDAADEAPQLQGRRLVALRMNDAGGMPQIAWTAGEVGSFAYRVYDSRRSLVADAGIPAVPGSPDAAMLADDAPVAERSVVTESADSATQFTLDGHRFLGPPVGNAVGVYVLSTNRGEYCLSRLDRDSGVVRWQQPLAYAREAMNRLARLDRSEMGFNTCLMHGESIVCALQDGTIVSVAAADGRCRWATVVDDAPEPNRIPAFGVPVSASRDVPDDRFGFTPVTADGIIVCSTPQSRYVSAVDAHDGRILWRKPRVAFGDEDAGGSRDQLVAGIVGTQVILVGDRHCRSLDLRTGEALWTTEVGQSAGRGECRGDRCLIPMLDGSVVAVAVANGVVIDGPRITPDSLRHPTFGTLTTTDSVVCLSTPVSLAIYPRADSIVAARDAGDGKLHVEAELRRSEAALLDGRTEDAIAILKAALTDGRSATPSGDDSTQASLSLQQALAELLLQQWAAVAAEGSRIAASDATAPRDESGATDVAERTAALSELSLSTEQELRAAMLSVMSQPSPDRLSEDLARDLRGFREWTMPVPILKSWSARPDLLLEARVGRPATQPTAESTTRSLRIGLPDRVLFANHSADAAATALDVELLLKQGYDLEAELLLLSSLQATDATAEHRDRLSQLLASLRLRNVIPGKRLDDATPEIKSDDAAATGLAGLTSQSKGRFTMTVEPYLRLPSAEWQMVEKGTPLFNVPHHVQLRYFHLNGIETTGQDQVVSFDPVDGAIRDQVTIPFTVGRSTINFNLLESGRDAPSLLPLTGPGTIGLLGCATPGTARLLWTRSTTDIDDMRPDQMLEVGPIGPDYFVWHAAGRLHCSHSLTGADLWTRELAITPSDTTLRSIRRIFGDAEAIVVMNADGVSCRRYSTRTGAELGSSRIQIAPTHDPVAVGRHLVYVDARGLVRIFDGATGGDSLDENETIAVGRNNPDRTFAVLDDGRVVTVTVQQDVVLVDTRAGRVVFRTSARPWLSTQFVFGVTAFERHGRLFVGIDDEQDAPGEFLTQFNRGADPRLGPGPLLNLDPATGEVAWGIRTGRALVPRISGDPTDLIVKWSQSRPSFRSRADGRGDTHNVRLIEASTGRLLATAASLSTAAPFRCVHSAEDATIRVYTRDAEVTIRAEAPPDARR